ncbi:hypothetical protein SLS62_004524 [Diatrype stigma]|uniref:J domain-containing protein n=1 Tax=Diatrype stigma TaxID=117547 RepID=A0AAN9V2S8_9PEZI
MDNKSDLLQYARDFVNSNEDLYALLGVDATTPKEDIHRAWRKSSLKYHPDKAGADFDAEKWQRFERARDVLSDPDARGAYDGARAAALQRAAERYAMDAKRRRMIEDLEARERGVKRPRDDDSSPKKDAMSEEERRRLINAGNRRMEERKRLMREAEERERLRELEKQQQQQQQKGREKEEEEKERVSQQQTHQPPSPERPRPEAGGAGGSGERPTTQPDVTMSDAPGANGAGAQNGDGYDAKIADLEQRLKEARGRKASKAARKAARKAEKTTKKEKRTAGKNDSGNGNGNAPEEMQTGKEAQEAPESTSPPIIPNPGVTELKADDQKHPPAVVASSSSPLSSIPKFSFPKPSVSAAADPFADYYSDDEA